MIHIELIGLNYILVFKLFATHSISLSFQVNSESSSIHWSIFSAFSDATFYIAIVLVAYHGPNKAILDNVGCDKWKWKSIPNLTNFLIALFRMFIIDLLALPVTCFIMWKFVSINFMKHPCRDFTNYWPYITAVAGGAVTKVQKFNDINLQSKYLSDVLSS